MKNLREKLMDLAGIANLMEQRAIETRNQAILLKLNLDKLIEELDNEEIKRKEFYKNLNNCYKELNNVPKSDSE